MTLWMHLREYLPEHVGKANDYIPALVVNAALVTGAVTFKWNAEKLILLYLFEIVIINVLFIGAAFFTAQPIRDHLRKYDERWDEEPAPVITPPGFPPMYRRNIGFAVRQIVGTAILAGILAWLFANAQSLGSILTLSTGTAAIGTIIFHLTRVWRHFIADQRYQNRTPAEALKFGFIPLRELCIILFFIIIPVSVTIVSVAIAMDIDGYSIPHFVLLAYLIPIGVLRVYIQGTDWHPHLREE
jgi:small-conductance mechanosensitive channel